MNVLLQWMIKVGKWLSNWVAIIFVAFVILALICLYVGVMHALGFEKVYIPFWY